MQHFGGAAPFLTGDRGPSTVLALGPHIDDVEIGCGATLLLLKRYYGATVHVRVFSNHQSAPSAVDRRVEGLAAAARMGYDSFELFDFPDTCLPDHWRQIQERVADLREGLTPHVVLCPNPHELHQDHQTVGYAALREFRYGEAVWHYEIHQFGSMPGFIPSLYIDATAPPWPHNPAPDGARTLTPTLAHEKVQILRETMASQLDKRLLQPEILLGLMALRGKEAAPTIRYAEAFSGRSILSAGAGPTNLKGTV